MFCTNIIGGKKLTSRASPRALGVTFLLIFSSLSILIPLNDKLTIRAQENQNHKQQEAPQYDGKIGDPLRVQTFFNESKFNDRLRLNKAYVKTILTSEMFGLKSGTKTPETLASVKVTQVAELKRCDKQLNLMQSNAESLVDCHPFEWHMQKEDKGGANPSGIENDPHSSSSSTQTTSFVKRHTLRNKIKGFKVFDNYAYKSGHEYHLYPLKQQIVDQVIEQTLIENNLDTGLGFGAQQLNLGYYFEANLTMQADPVQCVGQMYLAVNESEPWPAKYYGGSDNLPEFYQYIEHILSQSLDGFLLRLKEVRCGKMSDMIESKTTPPSTFFFWLDSEFTLVMKSTFPYWTCKHSIRAPPLETISILDYSGSIVQHKHKPDDLAYNTTITIDSQSDFHDDRFRLEQSFVNEDSTKGFEEMFFVHPFWSAIVSGEWSASSFTKKLRLFFMDPKNYLLVRDNNDDKLNPAAEVSFSESEDDGFLKFQFKIKKNFMQILDNIMKSTVGIDQQKPTPGELINVLRKTFNLESERKSSREQPVRQEL